MNKHTQERIAAIDPADLKRLRDIACDVWQYIGSDCGNSDNESAVELCFDADRPLLSRGCCVTQAEAADDHAFCKRMYAQHGFDTVRVAVANSLNLV